MKHNTQKIIYNFFTKKNHRDTLRGAENPFLCKQDQREVGSLCLILATLLSIILFSCDYCPAQEINLDHIAKIESNSNPLAVGDRGHAYGIFQISRSGILADFNKINGTNLKPSDLLSEEKSAHLAIWAFSERLPNLIRSFGKPVTERNLLIAWNCGVGCLNRKDIPKITKNYIKKYKELSK